MYMLSIESLYNHDNLSVSQPSPEEEAEKLERTLFVGNFPIKKNAKDQLKGIFLKCVNFILTSADMHNRGSVNICWRQRHLHYTFLIHMLNTLNNNM
jgi:hypothetical protein